MRDNEKLREKYREELQNYSKPRLVELCVKLLVEKEENLSDKAATYDELLEMDWNEK